MRSLRYLFPAILLLSLVFSCSTNDEREDVAPDYSNLITGTYSYTTHKGDNLTGSGTAIIAKESNSKIRIGLQDGVSFYANNLAKVDDDLIMNVPKQAVDYYQMDAQFSGTTTISRAGSLHHGVFFGRTGEMKIGLQISIGNQDDQVLLVLKR